MESHPGKGVMKEEKFPNTRKPSHQRVCGEFWNLKGQHNREGKKKKKQCRPSEATGGERQHPSTLSSTLCLQPTHLPATPVSRVLLLFHRWVVSDSATLCAAACQASPGVTVSPLYPHHSFLCFFSSNNILLAIYPSPLSLFQHHPVSWEQALFGWQSSVIF